MRGASARGGGEWVMRGGEGGGRDVGEKGRGCVGEGWRGGWGGYVRGTKEEPNKTRRGRGGVMHLWGVLGGGPRPRGRRVGAGGVRNERDWRWEI